MYVLRTIIFLSLLGSISGCSRIYYSTWEVFGKHKRDLLRDEVEAGREQQIATQEQFQDALQVLQASYGTIDQDMQERYDDLKASYDAADKDSIRLIKRIEEIEKTANDLFDEWNQEAESMQNQQLRSSSLEKLSQMQSQFRELSASLRSSQRTMEPVLVSLRDHTLYLKHNLNSAALGSLKQEAQAIELDIVDLVNRMDNSIRDSEKFLRTLE
jgi:predicted nuclease with TOPRIM domain